MILSASHFEGNAIHGKNGFRFSELIVYALGCLVTMAIGIAGSFVAFYLGRLLGWTSGIPDSLRPVGFIPSLLGAVILLLVYHWLRRKSGR